MTESETTITSTTSLTGRLAVTAKIIGTLGDDLSQPGSTPAEEEVAYVLELLAASIRLGRTDRLVAQLRGVQRAWAKDIKRLVGEDALRVEGLDLPDSYTGIGG